MTGTTKGHRDHELRDERRQRRFPDLASVGTAVLRLFRHVDAEGIRDMASATAMRQNAADDDGS